MGRLFRYAGLVVAMAAFPCGVASAQSQETQPAPPTDVSRKDGTLSDKLGATNGVIHPEGVVDPGMEKDPPATGRMPVIPPSGTPGGAPNAQPK